MREYTEFIPADRPNNRQLQLHVLKLELLESFEEKVSYWINNVKLDLFKQLRIDKEDGSHVYLQLLPAYRGIDKDKYIYKLLIEEYLELNPHPIKLRNEFLETCEDETDYYLPKKRYLEIINEIVTSDRVNHLFNQGYKAFKGSDKMEHQLRDLLDTFHTKFRSEHDFMDAYSGYLYAIQEEFIRTRNGDTIKINSAESNISPLTAAIVLKHYGIIDFMKTKHQISNDKAVTLITNLFNNGGGVVKGKSVRSSYADLVKMRKEIAQSKALKFLNDNGITETKLDL